MTFLSKKAEIIENYVCNHSSLKDLSFKYGLSEQTISAIISKYFAYKGLNKEVLILESKI